MQFTVQCTCTAVSCKFIKINYLCTVVCMCICKYVCVCVICHLLKYSTCNEFIRCIIICTCKAAVKYL